MNITIGTIKGGMNLLSQSGPLVYVVVLHADGTAKERLLDMSPSKLPLVILLGGRITINGQYVPQEVIVVKRYQGATAANKHVLPPPFESDQIQGDIGLVRMNAQSIPESFRLSEYFALQQQYLVTRRRVYQRKNV